MECNTLHYTTIHYRQENRMECDTIQYNAMQYNTIQYNSTQHSATQYNTMQYKTATLTSRKHSPSSMRSHRCIPNEQSVCAWAAMALFLAPSIISSKPTGCSETPLGALMPTIWAPAYSTDEMMRNTDCLKMTE
jgi:hypothetical protein